MIKNLLRRVWRTKPSIFARNLIGVRPIYRRWQLLEQSYAASDQFLWRTDNDFQTEFRVSDIVGKYYQQKSLLRVHIFDRLGREINSFERDCEEAVERIFIDGSNAESDSYGTFCVFHIPKQGANVRYAITNRCYTGYSRLGSIPSFVHGNLLSKICILGADGSYKLVSGFIKHKKKTDFYIQKDHKSFEQSELVLTNPLEISVNVMVEEKSIKLKPGEVRLITIDGHVPSPLKIKSDFFFPRPIIFSYRNRYFDVHHA